MMNVKEVSPPSYRLTVGGRVMASHLTYAQAEAMLREPRPNQHSRARIELIPFGHHYGWVWGVEMGGESLTDWADSESDAKRRAEQAARNGGRPFVWLLSNRGEIVRAFECAEP